MYFSLFPQNNRYNPVLFNTIDAIYQYIQKHQFLHFFFLQNSQNIENTIMFWNTTSDKRDLILR